MAGNFDSSVSRRTFLGLVGRGAVMLPVVGLSACSKPDRAANAPQSDSGGQPHLDPNDPSAKSVGYYPDAADIDTAKYPQHMEGQACWKCVLFQGAPNDAWGPCSVFAGKLVNARGWCTAFAAKA